MNLSRLFRLAVAVLSFAACATTPAPIPAQPRAVSEPASQAQAPVQPASAASAEKEKSLFERLGGMPAIEAVVADFQQNVAADERINAPFAVADLTVLRKRLVEFMCVATGGPCRYTGRDMRASHKGMNVTHAQFDALVGALVKTLEKFKVPEREKGEILAALGPLREQIVEFE